jgi:hypothetical protein
MRSPARLIGSWSSTYLAVLAISCLISTSASGATLNVVDGQRLGATGVNVGGYPDALAGVIPNTGSRYRERNH